MEITSVKWKCDVSLVVVSIILAQVLMNLALQLLASVLLSSGEMNCSILSRTARKFESNWLQLCSHSTTRPLTNSFSRMLCSVPPKSVPKNISGFYIITDSSGISKISKLHPLSPGAEVIECNLEQINESKVASKMKLLVKQYGTIAVVFHVSISMVWLGSTYALVDYGLDLVSLVSKLGMASAGLQAKIAGGASTFVVAYAVHKCFALVRLTITAACVPLLVRYFRKVGMMKQPLSGKNPVQT